MFQAHIGGNLVKYTLVGPFLSSTAILARMRRKEAAEWKQQIVAEETAMKGNEAAAKAEKAATEAIRTVETLP